MNTPKPGDVVRLRSGGPDMTVLAIDDTGERPSPWASFGWFAGDEYWEATITLAAVVPAPAGLADEMDRRMGEDGPIDVAEAMRRLEGVGEVSVYPPQSGDRFWSAAVVGPTACAMELDRDAAILTLDAECRRLGLYPDPEPAASAFLATIPDVLDDAVAAGDTGVEPVAPGGFPTPRMGETRPTIAEIHAELSSVGFLTWWPDGGEWKASVAGHSAVGTGTTPQEAKRALHRILKSHGVIPARSGVAG